MKRPGTGRRTKLGGELEEAFLELAAGLRGEVELEEYEIPDDTLTASRIKAIRRGLAS